MKHEVLVVMNGYFCISPKAVEWLANNSHDGMLRYFISYEREKLPIYPEPDAEGKALHLAQNISYYLWDKRHHKDLLRMYKALGEEASVEGTSFGIADVDGELYAVEEFDGGEVVITPEKGQWIIIDD